MLGDTGIYLLAHSFLSRRSFVGTFAHSVPRSGGQEPSGPHLRGRAPARSQPWRERPKCSQLRDAEEAGALSPSSSQGRVCRARNLFSTPPKSGACAPPVAVSTFLLRGSPRVSANLSSPTELPNPGGQSPSADLRPQVPVTEPRAGSVSSVAVGGDRANHS